MIEALRTAFRVPDLRKRILFTIAMLAIYRFGAHVPVPGVNPELVRRAVTGQGVLGFLDLLSGGGLQKFAVFALGIMPYITATIIMQLLTVVIPTLEKWSKEGEAGQKKMTQWTRYLTLTLAIVESFGYIFYFQAQLHVRFPLWQQLLIVITLTAGTAVIMWMAELITQRGVGNGMSLLIFTSIIARMPAAIFTAALATSIFVVLALLVVFVAVIIAVVFMEGGQRRIPVQYAKRVVGRKMYGGQQTYIPLKVNTAGVIPIIFASSVLIFPSQILQFASAPWAKRLSNAISGGPLFIVLESMLIIFFAYFYTAIVFNPLDLADNIKKYGGFIPGVRPGRPTAEHLDSVLNRITLPGGIFLAAIAALPNILFGFIGGNIAFFQFFGGTSILIMVSVALETMKQIESQLLMRHYEGFFK